MDRQPRCSHFALLRTTEERNHHPASRKSLVASPIRELGSPALTWVPHSSRHSLPGGPGHHGGLTSMACSPLPRAFVRVGNLRLGSARRAWRVATTCAPSPTAEATRLTELD